MMEGGCANSCGWLKDPTPLQPFQTWGHLLVRTGKLTKNAVGSNLIGQRYGPKELMRLLPSDQLIVS